MDGRYDVALYCGNLSCRWVPDNSTTVYADQVLASFDNEIDAYNFIGENEQEYYREFEESLYPE